MMEEMSWSYDDLMNCPYEKYLDYSRIASLESKNRKKEAKKNERKARNV